MNYLFPVYERTGVRIEPGQWVRVFVAAYGGVWHHGIVRRVFWMGSGFAVEVIHNQKADGVIVSDWYDFAGGGVVHLHKAPSSPWHAIEIVSRAEAQIGKPYHVFAQNCEHLASFAFVGEAKSETVTNWGVLVAASVALVGLIAWANGPGSA